MSEYNWISLFGEFNVQENVITYIGKKIDIPEEDGSNRTVATIGNFICNQYFGSGTISADIQFKNISHDSSCQFILFHDPELKLLVNGGFSHGASLVEVRTFYDGKWTYHASAGNRNNLESGKIYKLKINVKGSNVRLKVDDILLLNTNLPYSLPRGQVGIWCIDCDEIYISNYKVEAEKPKAFTIMQFTSPYDEIYTDVIEKTCFEMGIEPCIAKQTQGPGLIISDIIKQITESNFIIADITPDNPNVFYEVGYAHAMNKPTILMAEENRKLPFDVSPFRTLFYNNSIGGKNKMEEALKQHIAAIMNLMKVDL